MSELISLTEAGRRLSISRQMVARYRVRGMPGDDAGKVLWPEAQAWYDDNVHPSMSGSWAARQRENGLRVASKRRQSGSAQVNMADPGTAGFVAGFQRARRNLREEIPKLLGTAVGLQPGERVFYMAMLDFLMEGWLDVAPDRELPPVDWSQFRNEIPDELQQFFDETKQAFADGREVQYLKDLAE